MSRLKGSTVFLKQKGSSTQGSGRDSTVFAGKALKEQKERAGDGPWASFDRCQGVKSHLGQSSPVRGLSVVLEGHRTVAENLAGPGVNVL